MTANECLHDELRRLAGQCYLALRHADGTMLLPAPRLETLRVSGLAGMYANLCVRYGIAIDKQVMIGGMQLALANEQRWAGLVTLLEQLRAEGIEPVLFKGAALHARWPAMRELRALSDYDLIVPQAQLAALQARLAQAHFHRERPAFWLSRRLSKASMAWHGQGLAYQNLDLHARVTEPPVCHNLTRSLLASQERAQGLRVPDIEDCVCMIALHIVRSGMHRPLREYIDLLWYVDALQEPQWRALLARAQAHHLLPALFLALRQAHHCLALDVLAPESAQALATRISALQAAIGPLRRRLLDWLAPADYPLQPVPARDHPLFRRSLILGVGTSSVWRVAAAFFTYGIARLCDRLTSGDAIGGVPRK